jgi:hypothetical protein
MDDMAEPICDFEYEGKTFTLMKFTQPYFVVGRKGEGGEWELLMGERAEEVFDWVLESGELLCVCVCVCVYVF